MKKTLYTLGLLAFPVIVLAQPVVDFVDTVGTVVEMIVPIVSLIVIIYFFWGLAKYVLSAGDAEKAAEGKSIMIWGVLALFVMVTIWGIIGFLQASVGNTAGPTEIDIDLPDIESSEGTLP